MNNKSLKSIISVANKHGYKAKFKLRHIPEWTIVGELNLGDIFTATKEFGTLVHDKSGKQYKLKGSYVSFEGFQGVAFDDAKPIKVRKVENTTYEEQNKIKENEINAAAITESDVSEKFTISDLIDATSDNDEQLKT